MTDRSHSQIQAGLALLRYLTVPLRAASLVLIVLFAFLLMIALSGGLLGIPLAFIVLSWFFKYGFALLDSVANGSREPPVLSYEMVNPLNEQRPLALAVLVAGGYVGSTLVAAHFGRTAGHAVLVAIAVVLPAIIAVYAAGDDPLEALNPVAWLRLIRRTAFGYLILLALAVCIMWLGAVTLVPQAELPRAIDLRLPESVRLAFAMYGWLAIFALIGALLFEHRLHLGFEPVNSPERDQARADGELERKRQAATDRVFAEYRGGSFANAWDTALAYANAQPDWLAEMLWMLQRARAWPDQRIANRFAREVVPKLLAAKRTGEALDIVRERLHASAHFQLADGKDLVALAQLAKLAGHRTAARQLITIFERDFPDHPDSSVARRLHDELKN
ncbi:MAG TPA: hypothetical protein VFS47_13060 [Steroidobacteraceae bacterium]|nr:hypothetical protein [Steroidobacteraceae bacterium]